MKRFKDYFEYAYCNKMLDSEFEKYDIDERIRRIASDCTYEELFNAIDVDLEGNECDLEGYEELKMTDEWVEQGKNKTERKQNIFTT